MFLAAKKLYSFVLFTNLITTPSLLYLLNHHNSPTIIITHTEIPGYGDRSAVTMCERLDIKSTKDTLKLKQAKDEVYLKGFYEGVMLVGECAGMKVSVRVCSAVGVWIEW